MSVIEESNQFNLPLALTMGDPAGISCEITLKAWWNLAKMARKKPIRKPLTFFVIADPHLFRALSRKLNIEAPIQLVETPEQAASVFSSALPVMPLNLPAAVIPGRPDPENASSVINSIDRALDLALGGRTAGIVTNPIHKKCLAEAGFTYSGHTEYLAECAGIGSQVAMMLATPHLRVVPVTVHVALAKAIHLLTKEMIVTAAHITATSLVQDFGIPHPRIAVAGLNPHAGESGEIGREEIEIITPAIEEIRNAGILVNGPSPADTLFHASARTKFDAALCMYHDQALIPIKTVDFENGVNITLGLPFVRTSPNHGTALDLAMSGKARERSLLVALTTAHEIARRRNVGLKSVA